MNCGPNKVQTDNMDINDIYKDKSKNTLTVRSNNILLTGSHVNKLVYNPRTKQNILWWVDTRCHRYVKGVVTYSLEQRGLRVVINYNRDKKRLKLIRLSIHHYRMTSKLNIKGLPIITTCRKSIWINSKQKEKPF